MKPLILTGGLTPDFTEPDFADLAIRFIPFRFVWGQLPSSDELADLSWRPHVRSPASAVHWSDFA